MHIVRDSAILRTTAIAPIEPLAVETLVIEILFGFPEPSSSLGDEIVEVVVMVMDIAEFELRIDEEIARIDITVPLDDDIVRTRFLENAMIHR